MPWNPSPLSKGLPTTLISFYCPFNVFMCVNECYGTPRLTKKDCRPLSFRFRLKHIYHIYFPVVCLPIPLRFYVASFASPFPHSPCKGLEPKYLNKKYFSRTPRVRRNTIFCVFPFPLSKVLCAGSDVVEPLAFTQRIADHSHYAIVLSVQEEDRYKTCLLRMLSC